MIEFHNVSKTYDNQTAVRSITFSIGRGELAFVTGPSGSGKSTILKLIYLAERPDDGRIIINNKDSALMRESEIPYLRRDVGVVFQDFRLLPNKNVFDNVALALRIRKISETEIKPIVHETLKMVGLRHKSDSYPLALSGGEQQRVVIARAFIGEPIILLADEPTGNLDPDAAAGIMRIFREINARGTTIVIATHNKELFRNTGKRLFRLDNGNLVAEETG